MPTPRRLPSPRLAFSVHRLAFAASFLLSSFILHPSAFADVSLLAIGDTGNASPNQHATAAAMAKHAETAKPAAVLMAGDIFYLKATRPDDPSFTRSFAEPYDHPSLKIPFYGALGNHDHDNGKLPHVLAYARSGKSQLTIPDLYYRLDFPKDAKDPLVTVLMLNSNRPLMPPADWDKETRWLEDQLKDVREKSPDRWLVTCFHHPPYSNGSHGDVGPIKTTWVPLFNQYKVDLVVAGHDHDLQHLQIPSDFPSYIMVGGGGASTRAMSSNRRGPFSKRTYGFASLTFTPTTLTTTFLNPHLDPLHTFTRSRTGQIQVTATTPSDPATPRTTQRITRPDKDKD